MKVRLLTVIFLLQLVFSATYGQTTDEQVLDAYFRHLTRQHQLQRAISSELLQISAELYLRYDSLLLVSGDAADLQWTYFLKELERTPAAAMVLDQCRQERKLQALVNRFHNFRLIAPLAQAPIDTSQSMQRLQFFGLSNGGRVAEIGFGYGYNLNLLGLIYDSLQIYANELDDYRLHKMEQEVHRTYPEDRGDNFHFVPGAIASTRLEGQEMDLIIMENVLHHIDARPEFIQSMIASLDLDGSVVIIEEFPEAARAANQCPDLMPRADLEELFRRAGFLIEREQELGHKTMLRFTLRQMSK